MVVLAFILFSLFFVGHKEVPQHEYVMSQTTAVKIDERQIELANYFHERNMPLEDNVNKFLEVADKNYLDWRLLPAIAIQESSGGKHMKNNNPFGWGSCEIKFKSIDEAIEEVGAHLSGKKKTTEAYYKNKTISEKLHAYNKRPSYPQEVINKMKKINQNK
jgi:hypothetical protein